MGEGILSGDKDGDEPFFGDFSPWTSTGGLGLTSSSKAGLTSTAAGTSSTVFGDSEVRSVSSVTAETGGVGEFSRCSSALVSSGLVTAISAINRIFKQIPNQDSFSLPQPFVCTGKAKFVSCFRIDVGFLFSRGLKFPGKTGNIIVFPGFPGIPGK